MMKKPDKCCPVGYYHCSIPMPIRNRVEGIDFCVADIVAALNAGGVETSTSCCGHEVMPGHVMLKDGRELIIVKNAEERNEVFNIMKKFYKTQSKRHWIKAVNTSNNHRRPPA